MALINCPDCGKEVSDIAPACPNCGRAIKARTIEKTAKKYKGAITLGTVMLPVGILVCL